MTKATAVPYCTVKAFRASLEILRIAPPAIVDRDSLVERGLSTHAAYPVLGAFRFLGLIDGRGHLTPNVEPFLDKTDMAGRRIVFETAYSAILVDVHFPVEEREDVDVVLTKQHDVADGVAAFCATFFLWLAAESGIAVAEVRRARRGRPPAHLAQLSDAARAALIAHARADADELDAFVKPGSAILAVEALPEAPARLLPRANPQGT